MAGMGHSITIPRLLVEFTLCRDPYTTFLDELKEAFVSAAGWLHSQIDAVFALGETKDTAKFENIFSNFPQQSSIRADGRRAKKFGHNGKVAMYV